MLFLPTQALAAEGEGGGGGGGGHPTDNTGSLYSDLVVALRAEDGTPVLKKYDVPADAETEATTEFCVQPVSYEPVPGVSASTNPLDGREVWVLPLQGEWLPPYTGEIPVEEIEACDPKPQYAMFVVEAELERLNLARTSDEVIADKLAAVEEKLTVAKEIGLDGAGRITTDGASLDASPEFAAMYQSLMKTGSIPGLPDDQAGPPAQVDVFDAWKLAAAAIGTAAGKEVPITVDTIEYYNRVVGFPEDADYTSPWGVDFIRSEDPSQPGTPLADSERFVDYSGFTYNRSQTFTGSVTWLDVPSLTWKVSRIADVVEFTQLTGEPIGNRTLTGVTAFAQLADDVRAVILYYHDHETIPGFFIDSVGQDTTAAQEAAMVEPAVDLAALPASVFQTEPFQFTAKLFNPWGGTDIEHARLRITVDADADLQPADLVVTTAAGGEVVPFTSDGGDLTGWWGAEDGFEMPRGHQSATDFDVTVADGSPLGEYDVHLELVDLDADLVRATDAGTTTIRDNVPTVAWASEIYPLVEQGSVFKVPVTVYSPTAGEADLQVTFTGPGDDPATDLIEELRQGDAKVYASNGSDMVALPLTLDAEGRLTGTWHASLAAGFNPITWFVTITEGALVGSYGIDVALDGGNAVETVMVSVAPPESHGQQPPDAGEDTTAPVVTITPVGTLSTDASFTLSANEADVTYQVRLVKDDVPGAWEPLTGAAKSYTDLTPGTYSFQVKGTDAAGNVSGMYSKTWVVAPEPAAPEAPGTRFTGGPAAKSWVLSNRARFEVASNDPAASFIVTVNGRYIGTSTSRSILVTGLRSGTNRIAVRAIANGLADQTASVRRVFVPRGVVGMDHTRAWSIRAGQAHLFRRYAQTARYGEVFRMRSGNIKRVALVVTTSAQSGRVRVFLNGRPLTTGATSLRSATSKGKVLIPIRTFAHARQGVITVKVVSRGKVVRLEGIGVASR